MDIFFFEAFTEESEQIKRFLPPDLDAGFTGDTIQEYGHSNDVWGTYIAELSSDDCNNNLISDACDIDCGGPGGDLAVRFCAFQTVW